MNVQAELACEKIFATLSPLIFARTEGCDLESIRSELACEKYFTAISVMTVEADLAVTRNLATQPC